MKKGRAGQVVSALVDTGAAGPDPVVVAAVRTVLLTHTSSIGCRESTVARHTLPRSERSVAVLGGWVRVKDARLGGRVVNSSPEHADVAALAAATGLPEKVVLAAAVAAATATHAPPDGTG